RPFKNRDSINIINMTEKKFQQDSKSFNAYHFTNPSLLNHQFYLSDLIANVEGLNKRKTYTSPFILRRSLSHLLGNKPHQLSQLHYEFERAKRVLGATGIFQEMEIELEDADLLNEKSQSNIYGRDTTNIMDRTKSPYIHFLNAKL